MGFVDDCIMSKPEQSAKIDISALIIDLSERVPDPQPIVRIRGNLIASRGNVSAVVGLAKSPHALCLGHPALHHLILPSVIFPPAKLYRIIPENINTHQNVIINKKSAKWRIF